MASDEEIDHIASKVADKLKVKMGTAVFHVGKTTCDTKDKYDCSANSFACQAGQFDCPVEFNCYGKFTGFTRLVMW